jgi:hypothetical protein
MLQQKFKKRQISFLLNKAIIRGYEGKLITDHIFKSFPKEIGDYTAGKRTESVKEIVNLYMNSGISLDDLKRKVIEGYEHYYKLKINFAFDKFYPSE